MYEVFKVLLDLLEDYGDVARCDMSKTYSSIDVTINDEKYLVTIMKEGKKDDSV